MLQGAWMHGKKNKKHFRGKGTLEESFLKGPQIQVAVGGIPILDHTCESVCLLETAFGRLLSFLLLPAAVSLPVACSVSSMNSRQRA